MADQPEDLIDLIDAVLSNLHSLPPDQFGGRPWDQMPVLDDDRDEADHQRERWQLMFHDLFDKLNWHFVNSIPYRQLEITTLRNNIEWAMFSTASVKRDLLRARELLLEEIETRRLKAPVDPRRVYEDWEKDGWSEKLRKARLSRSQGLKEVADTFGVPMETYRKWETRRPGAKYVVPILGYMGIDCADVPRGRR